MSKLRWLGVVAAAAALLTAVVPASGVAAAGTSDGRWRRLATTGEGPSERSAPVAAGLDGRLYVFGGGRDDFATGQSTFYNDLHRLDVDRNRWSRLSPSGQLPPARAFAAGAADPASHRIFVFGGSTFAPSGADFQPFDDLWAYSVTPNRWARLVSSTPGPSARSGATMWVVGERLYVFGGIDATFTVHNDLWAYDLRRSAWAQVPVTGAVPPARHVAQAGTVAPFGRLTVYGGESIDPEVGFVLLGDTWEFDLVRQRWREVTPAAANIWPARNYGAAAILGRALYLQGGDVSGGEAGCGAPFPQNPTDELWRFDLVRRVWQRLDPGGDPLARLKRHAAATVGGRMFVVSGWDFRCPGGVGPGQVWNLDTFAFTPPA
jgi:N-acetylneuraminic acid mutarotase